MSRNLIYSCVFNNPQYIELVRLLLTSYKQFGKPTDNTDYLLICDQDYQARVNQMLESLDIKADMWCLKARGKFQGACTRLKIFQYEHVNNYDKLLYLDCDVLITNDINNLFGLQLDNKLYALREGATHRPEWGSEFFGEHKRTRAFSSGVLLFNNHASIRDLFTQTQEHIDQHVSDKLQTPGCLDQPFIVYHAFKNDMYNNLVLEGPVINNPKSYNGQTISHFAGGQFNPGPKLNRMKAFLKQRSQVD